MLYCNHVTPWKHFQRSIAFRACQYHCAPSPFPGSKHDQKPLPGDGKGLSKDGLVRFSNLPHKDSPYRFRKSRQSHVQELSRISDKSHERTGKARRPRMRTAGNDVELNGGNGRPERYRHETDGHTTVETGGASGREKQREDDPEGQHHNGKRRGNHLDNVHPSFPLQTSTILTATPDSAVCKQSSFGLALNAENFDSLCKNSSSRSHLLPWIQNTSVHFFYS